MDWPPDLRNHILGLALSRDACRQAAEFRARFRPCSPNLAPLPPSEFRVRRKRACDDLQVPWLLRCLYEAFDPDVCFVHGAVTLFSELEFRMKAVTDVVHDFASCHVSVDYHVVFAYDPASGAVLKGLEGGSDAVDVVVNRASRLAHVRAWVQNHDLPWIGWFGVYETFDDFWKEEVLEHRPRIFWPARPTTT